MDIPLISKKTIMKKILVFLLMATTFGCSSKQDAKQDTASTPAKKEENKVDLTDAQIKNAGIETGKPEMRTMQALLKVNGLIDVPPQNMVTVSFPSGGYLKNTTMLPGMRIRKGQVLAVMQDPSFVQMQEDYLMAQTKVAFLQKEYERQKLLNESKATSDKVFEQTASDYQLAKISAKALREKLLLIGINPSGLNENTISRTVNIYSPIAGYVSVVKVNIGKYVNPTDVLFELVNPDDLHLALTIFEKDLPLIHPGQIVKTYLTGDTNKTYNARVMLVGKTLDSNRSTMVHCHFIGTVPKLLPGMFMNANIEVTNSSTIAVPEQAVVRSGDKDYIFIQRKVKQFELTQVSTAVTENGYIAIKTGDKDLLNQVIIKKNAYAVLMKMKNVAEAE
jgi:cobalt-zinc-cadmium efflux system membrane fusion protein